MNTKFKQLGTRSLTDSHPVVDVTTFSGSGFKGEHLKETEVREEV